MKLFFYFLFTLFFVFSFSKKNYQGIVKSNLKNYSTQFKVKLSSPFIKNQIEKNIPKEDIDFNSKPYLSFIFHKNKEYTFILKNVSEFYQSYFNNFLNLFKQSGFLFGLHKDSISYQKVMKKYVIKIIDPNKKKDKYKKYPTLMKVTQKNAIPGDYAFYCFDKNWDIAYSEYFEENKKISHVVFVYGTVKKRKVVKKMEIFFSRKNGKEIQTGNFAVEFKDYSWK